MTAEDTDFFKSFVIFGRIIPTNDFVKSFYQAIKKLPLRARQMHLEALQSLLTVSVTQVTITNKSNINKQPSMKISVRKIEALFPILEWPGGEKEKFRRMKLTVTAL
jgi:hypothetical protein